MKTNGQTILITGGGSGIGLALAHAFLKADNRVIITGRNLEKLEAVKAQTPAFEIAQCDVTNDAHIKALVARCTEEFGGIDVLVNNAGVFQSFDYKTGALSIEDQIKEVDIDFNGPIKMLHYFLPSLLEKDQAAVVNVSSGLAFVPVAYAPVYCATKAAMHSWTRSLRWQLARTNVKVFELMPPLVNTEMVSEFKKFPMMEPDDLAAAFMAGFAKDQMEITPGQSGQLKMMSKLAPNFIFKQLNKNFSM